VSYVARQKFADWVQAHMTIGTRPRGQPTRPWKDSELAKKCQCTTGTVKNWRLGKNLPPSLTLLEAAVLGTGGGDDQKCETLRRQLRRLFDDAVDEKKQETQRKLFGKLTLSPAGGPIEKSGDLQARAEVASAERTSVVTNLPSVPSHFADRTNRIPTIRDVLRSAENRVAKVALYGLRGVGKTTLAIAYAKQHEKNYRAIWMIRAQTPQSASASLVALGIKLGWVNKELSDKEAYEKVAEELNRLDDNVLLIYDNAISAESVRQFLPENGRAHVIITSNARAWGGVARKVEIDVWPDDVGGQYLVDRLEPPHDLASAKALSHTLGGLVLALEQAATLCEHRKWSFVTFQEKFEARLAEFLKDSAHVVADYHTDEEARNYRTVWGTFGLVLEEAAKRPARNT
jgi:GTPase SAR1 family protein